MTHEELRKLAMTVLRRSRWKRGYGQQVGFNCSVVLSELVTVAGDIPDAIGWEQGHSVMIECKTSRADFFADAKKSQRLSGTGCGQHRYFMVPKGLITHDELPAEWGLLEVNGREVTMPVHCSRRVLDIPGHAAEKLLLLSTIRRIRTREFLMVQMETGDCACEESR